MYLKRVIFSVIIFMMLFAFYSSTQASGKKTLFAFSLKAAEERIRAQSITNEIERLGYITKPLGLIIDVKTGDCIIFGERDVRLPELFLDDLVAILRAILLFGEVPGVTIEPRGNPYTAKVQDVRFFGGIEGSHAGLVSFDSDYLMKKIGLGLERRGVKGIKIYFDSVVEESRQENRRETRVASRFWFYPIVSRVITVENGIFLKESQLAVLTEILSAQIDGEEVVDLKNFHHKASEDFSRSFTNRFDSVAEEWPVLKELNGLARLVALAQGLTKVENKPELKYWLKEYRIKRVDTPCEVEVLYNRDAGIEVSGGVFLQALALRLKEGDVSAFADIVLAARPSKSTLTWHFTLTEDLDVYIPIPEYLKNVDHTSVAELYVRGDYLFQTKQYDLAIACWRQVLMAYPEAGEVYYRIGQVFERKNMLSCAADYYTKALELDQFLINLRNSKAPYKIK